jgi:hypothetical protein
VLIRYQTIKAKGINRGVLCMTSFDTDWQHYHT